MSELIQGEWVASPTRMMLRYQRARVCSFLYGSLAFVGFLLFAPLIGFLGASVVVPILFVIASWSMPIGVLIGAVAILALCVGIIYLGSRATSAVADHVMCSRRATAQELELLEDADDPGLAVAEAVFRKAGRAVGVDRGVIWVSDGLMHFRGTSCYFSVALCDYRMRTERSWADLDLSFGHSVRLHPLLSKRFPDWRFSSLIGSAAQLCADASVVTEPRVLPPDKPFRRRG